MAQRSGSFSFAKRQKELKREKKKREKLERKAAKAAGLDQPPNADESNPANDELATEASSPVSAPDETTAPAPHTPEPESGS